MTFPDEDYGDIKDSGDKGPPPVIIKENKETDIEKGERGWSDKSDNSTDNNNSDNSEKQ